MTKCYVCNFRDFRKRVFIYVCTCIYIHKSILKEKNCEAVNYTFFTHRERRIGRVKVPFYQTKRRSESAERRSTI